LKNLSVAFHDVSENHLEEAQKAIELFQEFDFLKIQLAVIPGSEFSHHLDEKLKEWKAEYWIHGWKHKADLESFKSRSWIGNQQLQWTHHEAEHAGLCFEDSQQLLNRALQSASRYSVPWRGYTPPTWWAPLHLKRLVLDAGLSYEGRFGFWHPRIKPHFNSNIPISLPSYASDTIWEQSLKFQNALIYSPVPIRLVLHPGDMQQNRILALKKWLERALIHRSQA
jgi:hypothetical protein